MTDTPVESTADNSTEAEATVAENAPVENTLSELLSEDLRENKALKNYDSVDAMAKSLLSAQEMVGKRVSDLSADELMSVSNKFGAPDKVEGYEFEAEEDFKAEALELGLNQVQAQKLLESRSAAVKELSHLNDEARKSLERGLEDSFNGKVEAGIDLARKAARELGGEELEASVFDGDGIQDLKVIKALSEAGKRLFDHESIHGDPVAPMSRSQVNVELDNILADPENRAILGNPMHGSHRDLTDEVNRLSAIKSKLKG